jgi:phage gpG-like protein
MSSKFKFDVKSKNAVKNMANMVRRIGEIAVDHTKNSVFPSRGWNGTRWRKRQKPTGQWPILEKTGKMRRSVKVVSTVGNTVTIGSNVPYAGYHNWGTPKMVKRKFLGMESALNLKISKFILKSEQTLVK